MYTLVGFKEIHFTNKETGEAVNGVKVALLADQSDSAFDDWKGQSVSELFFGSSRVNGSLAVGKKCTVKTVIRNGKLAVAGLDIIN